MQNTCFCLCLLLVSATLVSLTDAVRVRKGQHGSYLSQLKSSSSLAGLDAYYFRELSDFLGDLDEDGDDTNGPDTIAGSLVATNATSSTNCDDLTKMFGARFKDTKKVGEGNKGCVILAKDTRNGNREVAIKLAKSSWESVPFSWECQTAKGMHMVACAKGKDVLNLAENYLPSCLESSGKMSRSPYMVMDVARGRSMGGALAEWSKRRFIRDEFLALPKDQRLSIYVQLIGALAAMHSTGWSHNDLHLENIHITEETPPRVTLIDFGMATKHSKAKTGEGPWNLFSEGEKTTWAPGGSDELKWHPDAVNLESVAVQLLRCPRGNDDRLFDCLKKEWGADDEFVHALKQVLANNKAKKMPGNDVPSLYRTAFVQKHQPPLKKNFQTGACPLSEAPAEPPPTESPTEPRPTETSKDQSTYSPENPQTSSITSSTTTTTVTSSQVTSTYKDLHTSSVTSATTTTTATSSQETFSSKDLQTSAMMSSTATTTATSSLQTSSLKDPQTSSVTSSITTAKTTSSKSFASRHACGMISFSSLLLASCI